MKRPKRLLRSTPQAATDTVAGNKPPGRWQSFRRNVLPPLAGLLVALAVVGLMNGEWLQAQWQYRTHAKPADAKVSTQTVASKVGETDLTNKDNYKAPNPERGPYLTIPAISVAAPVVFEPSFAEWKVQIALRSGVDHYGTTANPGEAGNMVILGHSSGQPWAPGNYKFIFTILDKLQKDDAIYVDYNGTRYTYKVTGSVVIAPTDNSQIQPTATPTLSLVTCTPVGTSKNRLVVHADLVSPLPKAVAADNQLPTDMPTSLPASAHSSLWQRFLDLYR